MRRARLQQERGAEPAEDQAPVARRARRLASIRLPPTLAEEEFKNVWHAVNDLKAQGRTFEDEGTTEEKAREEYRAIADRRVRLGLVLAEIGEKNNISVTDDEIHAFDRRARVNFQAVSRKSGSTTARIPGGGRRARAHLRGKGGRLPDRAATVTDKAVSREGNSYKDDEDSAPAA